MGVYKIAKEKKKKPKKTGLNPEVCFPYCQFSILHRGGLVLYRIKWGGVGGQGAEQLCDAKGNPSNAALT